MKGRHTVRQGQPTASVVANPSRSGRHRRQQRRFGVPLAGLIVTIVAILVGIVPTASAAQPTGSCSESDIPVTSGLLTSTMHATLCEPPGGRADAPLQVLISGGTYNRTYWSGLGLDAYSYTARANAAGFATLAVDRIGTGSSSHPLSVLINATVQADALHQVISRARNGTLDGKSYRSVVLVGHSLGSMVSVIAAARHPGDINAVILTGYSHRISAAQLISALSTMRPAAFEGRPLDPGYLTTVPGTRAQFHTPGEFAPAILAAEEAAKDVASATELPDAVLGGLSPSVSRAIRVPVLEANGGNDPWACTAVDCSTADMLRVAEQPNFSQPLTTYVQARTGHSLALATDGEEFAAFATTWLCRVLTPNDGGNGS